MDLDEQGFPPLVPYSQTPHHPTNPNRMDTHQQPPQEQSLQPTQRQYILQNNYGNEPPSMLSNKPRYTESSRSIKEEQDLNTYLYSPPTDLRGEMNLNVHHPTHADHNTIRYPSSHNPYSSDLNSPDTGGLAMSIAMSSSHLESSGARLAPGPAETGPADFRYQLRALQHQHPQRHQHDPLTHLQHRNHTVQGSPPFYSPSMGYSSLDPEHGSHGGALDRHPQTQSSSMEYDSREPHPRHTSVPAMAYDSLPMNVPGHSQQGVRHNTTLNHRGSLASINSNSAGPGSYRTTNSPTSIPMSNNEHNRGTASSMNTSVPGAHTSSSFSMGPSNSSRWVGHPSGFDLAGSTPASPSASSSLRHIPRLSDSDSRSSPEDPFTQHGFRLRASTSAQTLSSSKSTHSYTNSPSPRLSDESAIGGQELFPDDRESDQDVDTNETVVRMSKRKEVMEAGEEVAESFLTPTKKKKKSKMHYCEVCGKKFPRPSGLKTHMNMHNNAKPFPCGFPGCNRKFGVRSNAKRHLRTHGVVPTPTANLSSTDAPYVVGFCPPMILVPQSSSHQQSQLHSVEGGEDFSPDMSMANIQPQSQVRLRWMPPSLTTRTNAGSLREVRDRQYVHEMVEVEEGDEEDEEEDEDEDDIRSGTGSVRHTGRGGYDVDMEQDDIEDGVGEGDEVEFGENIPRLSIPLHPLMASSSISTVAASSSNARLTVSHPTGCMCSPPCTGRCRSSPRTLTSLSPVSSTSFVRSNSSLSPPSISAYGQREIEMTDVGGGGVYSRNETISREYNVRETRTEEGNSYLQTGSHPYHPSQHPKYFQ